MSDSGSLREAAAKGREFLRTLEETVEPEWSPLRDLAVELAEALSAAEEREKKLFGLIGRMKHENNDGEVCSLHPISLEHCEICAAIANLDVPLPRREQRERHDSDLMRGKSDL